MAEDEFDIEVTASISDDLDATLQSQLRAEMLTNVVNVTAEEPPDLSNPHTLDDEIERLTKLVQVNDVPAEGGGGEESSSSALETTGKVVADIAVGIVSSPPAIVKGILESVADTGLLVFDWADSLSEKMLKAGISEEVVAALRANPEDRAEARATLLEFQENSESTVTGSMIRDFANFGAGFFFFSGKIKAAGKALGVASKLATKTGQIASNALSGALTEFVVLDGVNEELDVLLEEHPALRNPFAEFFLGGPDDTALDLRFKAALIGAGLGVAAEGVFRVAKALRSANRTRILLKRAEKQALSAERKLDLKVDAPELPKMTEKQTRLSDFNNDSVLVRVKVTDKSKKAARAIEKSEQDLAKEFPELTPAELRSASAAVRAEDVLEINFDAITDEGSVRQLMQDVTNIQASQVSKARRGVVPNTQTIKEADQLGIDIGDVLSRSTGEAANAATIQAYKTVWVSSAKQLEALSRAAIESGNPIDMFRFRKGVAVFNAINQSVLGARAEAGRALQAWRIKVGGDTERAAVMAQLVADSGGDRIGRKMAENILDAFASGKSPGQINAMLERGWIAKTLSAVKESTIVGLLWRPGTHLANITANSTRILLAATEKGVAARIGGETLAENSVIIGEATAQMRGTARALQAIFIRAVDAEEAAQIAPAARAAASAVGSIIRRGSGHGSFADAGKAIKETAAVVGRSLPPSREFVELAKATQESVAQTGRKFDTRLNAISAEGFGLSPNSGIGKTVEVIGNAIRVPVTALTKADDLFKMVAFAGEVEAQAFRQATREGAKEGWDVGRVARRIEELTTTPPEHIRLEAGNASLYSTFTQDAGSMAKLMLKARDTIPGAYIVLPFVRTPVNVLRYNFEFSPLALLVGQWRHDIAAGGARQSIALARLALGTSFTYLMSDLAWEGQIQGALSRKSGIREAMQRQNLEADSIRFGDFSTRVNRFEPIGMNLSVVGSLTQALKSHQLESEDIPEVSEIVAAIAVALADGVLDKTAFTGISRVVAAANYPDRRGAKFVQQTAQSLIPASSLLRTATQIASPERKDISGIYDSIQAMILGLEDRLPRAITLHGEPIVRDIVDIVNPFQTKKVQLNPIDSEIVANQMDIKRIPRRTNFAGVPIDFANFKNVFETYQILAGKGIRFEGKNQFETLNELVKSRDYLLSSKGPNGVRADRVRRVIRGFRKMSQAEIFNDPQFQYQSEEFVRFRQRIQQLQSEAIAIRLPSLENIQ